MENLEEYKLIQKLAEEVCDYGLVFEIVENIDASNYVKESYLAFPFVARFSIVNSEKFLGKPFEMFANVNETQDGFECWIEDTPYDVTGAEWFYLGYSEKLQDMLAIERFLSKVRLEQQPCDLN